MHEWRLIFLFSCWEQARVVPQRALKTINFREEQEKFNVWIAWLNLENTYGTTEAYDQLFEVRHHCLVFWLIIDALETPSINEGLGFAIE